MTVAAGDTIFRRRIRRVVAAMPLIASLASLAGCAGLSEMTAESVAIAPGQYDHYDCKQIEAETLTVSARELELRRLMERSAQGTGGEFVNAIAYRSDHLRARASLKMLAETAANKNCNPQSQWTSKRSFW